METAVKVFFLILILSASGLIFFAGYYYNWFFKPDPLKLLDQLFQKMENLKEYRITYDIKASVSSGGIGSELRGSAETIAKNGKIKTTIRFETPESSYFSTFSRNYYEYYTLPEGNVMCYQTSIIEPEYHCKEVESEVAFGETPMPPQAQTQKLQEWKDKGIAKISYEGEKKVAGRTCQNFRFDMDVEKLMKEEMEFLLYVKSENVNFTIFSCYDKETGIPLEFSFKFDIFYNYSKYYSSSSSMEFTYEATSFSRDAGIEDISLPVPYEKVEWLPNYRILETLCKPDSNEVKIAIEATKNIPAGLANLTLKYSTYGQSGDVYITSSYAYDGSYAVFIDPENDNWGGEKNYIYKTIDFGNSGKITWRWMIDHDAKYCGFRTLSYWLDGERTDVLDFCYAEKEKWYEYSLELSGTHKIGIGVYSPRDGNNKWDAAIDYIEVEKDGSKTIYSFEDGSLQGWNEYNSYGYKTERFKTSLSFDGARKGEIKILNFTLPQPLEADEYYSGNLYVNNVKQYVYCSTYKSRTYPLTGFFAKIIEKLRNITQSIF